MCDSRDRSGADRDFSASGAGRDPSSPEADKDSQERQGSQGHQPSPEVRFLVDGTAGRLVRWLRLLGFDAAYSEQAADYRLVHRARVEGRVVITRRRSAAALPWGNAILLESDRLDDQLAQIARRYPLRGRPMTRCSLCNAVLEDVSRASVEDVVPPFVFKSASGFSRCAGCGHVYWQGTHCSRITQRWKTLRKLAGPE